MKKRMQDLESNHPLVSVLVLTMNRKEELQRCLLSVEGQDYHPLELVVVDNGSTDGTVQMVEAEFPLVRFRALRHNLGAAGGRNKAFEMAQGDICIILDDDAELAEGDAIRRLVECFLEDPSLGVVALNIRNAFTGEVDFKAVPRKDKCVLPGWTPCTYFCAAGVAIRKSAFECAGGFWDELFIYAEELDLSYRILDCGYRMLHTTEIDVLHRETPRARPSDRYLRYATRNRIWVAWRNLPWSYALSMSVAWTLRNGWQALKNGQLSAFVAGWIEAVRNIRVPLSKRKVVSPETLAQLRRHSGRLWY